MLLIAQNILLAQEVPTQDNKDFVKSSLIVITPGRASYSSLGHCALRMECPSENLDYCFSLEMDAGTQEFINFFTGNAVAAVFGIPTTDFIRPYQQEGRGIKQYELDLTLKEEQQLWKNLDEEIVKPPHLKFNFLNTNCVMMCMQMIENALINETLHFPHLPVYMQGDNGKRIRYITRNNPWQQFTYISLAGSACDKSYDLEYTLSPETIVEILNEAEIRDNQQARPLFTGKKVQLLEEAKKNEGVCLTPFYFFLAILLIVLVISYFSITQNRQRWAKALDTSLLMIQTIVGIFLLYTSVAANLFGTRWNWYLIPFAPIPIIIWLIFHQKEDFYKIYLIYSIILVLFMCATPLSSQLDWIHQLAISPFLVRTATLYIIAKKTTKK